MLHRETGEHMRRTMIATLAVATTMGLTAGCSGGGVNEDAQKAAITYNHAMQTWADEVSAAGEDDTALGTALRHAPELAAHEDVKETPEYLATRAVAQRADIVSGELQSVIHHPELDKMAVNLWQLSTLYIDTLKAATQRRRAFTAALDVLTVDDSGPYSQKLLDASTTFAKTRLAALKEEETTIDSASAQSPLGDSMGAFMADWIAEEEAFQSDAIKQMSKWSSFGTPYKDFWWFANFTELPSAVKDNVSILRAGYLEQIPALAKALDAALALDPIKAPAAADLPAPGDPYRQALYEGYRPWDDAKADQGYTLNRLWLLWRVRELEDTPTKAYADARATLLEEINRKPPKAKDFAEDPRSGATRLLEVIGEYSDAFADDEFGITDNWLPALSEVHAYGVVLEDGPATAPVRSAFHEILALMAELNDKLAPVVKADDNDTIVKLGKDYQAKFIKAAEQALGDLDDDAAFKKQLETAVRATAPRSGR